MATLPEDAPFIKKFLNGDKGWAHSAQEFGVYAVLSSISGWLLSPILSTLVCIVLFYFRNKLKIPFIGGKYWMDREIKQSKAMGRNPTDKDLLRVPQTENRFWKLDAIEDVLFPRKMRKYWLISGIIYSFGMFFVVGFAGLLF